MASCDYEAISALVDDELEEAECQRVLDHMDDCPECRRLFERFHLTRSYVRVEGGATPPEGFCDRLLSALARETSSVPDNVEWMKRPGKRAAKTGWTWLATAAGLGALAVGTAVLWSPTPPGPSQASDPSFAQASPDQASQDPKAPQEPAAENGSPDSSPSGDMEAIERYLSEHSSFVSNGPRADFQRARLEASNQ